ncbi:glycosyltransferase family 4 protein [Ornithinimicrobium sediminis]|uniref:glycosyltransferase family 4 protein n=1 Tax=Ornithinimicrobium sediminis TaxID=2904603 RepID=UPI001E283F07|nr:glycosyltransferase family 4 protein [Ornithinimicrobium sediminis]
MYQHARAHEASGGTSYVLVNDERAQDYTAGTVRTFSTEGREGPEWFTARERRVDAALGALVGRRPMAARYFEPAMQAVPPDSRAVIVYNQPAAITREWCRGFAGTTVLHLGNDVFRRWSRREMVRASGRHDLVVAVSEFTAGGINRRAGREWVKVLRNGVDSVEFRPAAQPPAGVPVILLVGNMVPNKGAHHVLRAAARLAALGAEFTVRIVGSWGLSRWDELTPYEQDLRELARPLSGRVEFVPFVNRSDIADVYRAATVFCMPVEWDEPAGQVVTEAMASGLPVVSARRGGIPEYLGPDGIYVDPADPDALAGQLHDLLADPLAARQRGAALRARAESMSWEARMLELDLLLKTVQRE